MVEGCGWWKGVGRECMDERGLMEGWIWDGMDGWMEGWVCDGIDGRVGMGWDGWMDGRVGMRWDR